MTVVSSTQNPEALSLNIITEFDAPIERVWQVWADPRQLERWWAPPGYPMTFEEFDFSPGGKASYFMITPEGSKEADWWRFIAMDPPHTLEIADGATHDNGTASDGGPTSILVSLNEVDGRTRMNASVFFGNEEHLEQMVEMGMQEGFGTTFSQIDAILAK